MNRRAFAFNIWVWVIAWRDFPLFVHTIHQLAALRFNQVELGVPWGIVEKEPGRFDCSEVDRRVECILDKGVAIRLRVDLMQTISRWSLV